MAQQSLFSPNPAMRKGFESVGRNDPFTLTEQRSVMTMNGTLGIITFLLIVLVASGLVGWILPNAIIAIGCTIVALVVGIVTSFKPTVAPMTSVPYAILQGYMLGFLSAYYEARFDGIVVQAVGLTLAITVSLLLIYRTGLIKPSANFKLGVAAATAGIALFYIVALVGGLLGFDVPLIHSNSNFGILFSVFVVVLAAANLVVDFDFVEEGVQQGAPKYMEWYGAFGIMVTLIWLYIELLRLLAKLRSR